MRNIQKIQQKNATTGLLQALKQYKMHQGMANKQPLEEQEKCFLHQILTNNLQKIDIELLKLYGYLEDKGMDYVKDVVDLLFEMMKDGQSLQKRQKRHDPRSIREKIQIKNNQYCYECGKAIEKIKILKIRQEMGITYGEMKNEQNFGLSRKEKISIKDELSDDGFLEKFSHHIENINFHLQELMKAMEKEISSKTFAYLSKEADQLQTKSFNFEQEMELILKNEQNILQIQEYKNKFTQNFMKKLKIPICEAILKVVKNGNIKKNEEVKTTQKQQACQTLFTKQSQTISILQERISDLNRELVRIKHAKGERDKEIINFLEAEGKLKLENNKLMIQKQILQENLVKQKHNLNKIEAKYFRELNIKIRQIEKLTKLENQRSQIVTQKRNSLDRSRSSIGTIKDKKSSYNSIFERQSTSNLNSNFSRPSVDLTIYQQEMMELTSTSRFNEEKKAIGQRRATKFWNNQTKSILKAQINQIEETRKMEVKISEKLRLEKSLKLSIVNELSVTIEAKKLTENEAQKIIQARILENKNKKLKNLRTARVHKSNKNTSTPFTVIEQNHTTSNLSSTKQIQKLSRFHDIQKPRLKTQVSEAYPQIRRPADRFKSLIGSGRNLRSRAKDFRQEHRESAILNLNQITEQNLTLFGGENLAQEYEKNTGIWPHLSQADKLAIDFENTGYCINIQKHFKLLEETHPQVYMQYVQFLNYPIQVIQHKKKNLPSSELHLPEPSVKIRDIFFKIIRYHKFVHKGCNHVAQFLNQIGYNQA